MENEEALIEAVCQRVLSGELGVDGQLRDIGGDVAKDTIVAMSKAQPLVWSDGSKVTLATMKKVLREAKMQLETYIAMNETTEEPEIVPTQRAIEANGGVVPENIFDTCAVECKVYGDGLTAAAVRHPSEFTVEACDATGRRRPDGGDAFFVAIRGASRVRARIVDNRDGTYKVEWKPPQSGTYSIVVSFFGVPLSGSPFNVTAVTPVPYASNCVVQGDALLNAIARANQSFQVCFKDRIGHVRTAPDPDPGASTGPGRRTITDCRTYQPRECNDMSWLCD